jgi:hypothetical protein
LPCWLARSTLAVANLRLAPTSSASISATDRFSPSGVSQVRWRSRPVTRSPLESESARCSACYTFTLKNEVSSAVPGGAFGAEPLGTTAASGHREAGGAGSISGPVLLAGQPHDRVGVVLAAGRDGDPGARPRSGPRRWSAEAFGTSCIPFPVRGTGSAVPRAPGVPLRRSCPSMLQRWG